MVSPHGVVVVGAGHGGFHVGLFLRTRGFEGPITIVDGQQRLPYQRPPLSKDFLHGKEELVDTEFRPASFYDEHGITLLTGVSVEALDRGHRQVLIANRDPISYDDLVLATGSRPRPLQIPGVDLPGVLHLAIADDAAALRERIDAAERVVVIGGGFIGLESAAMAAGAGKKVTVFEADDRVMSRVVTEPTSRFYENLHRSHGVDLRLSSTVTAIEGDDNGVTAVVAGGSRHAADVVVIGIGSVPRDGLAASSGLATDNGILVGPTLQTSDPHVYAIGDCARFGTRFSRTWPAVRLESVQNATDQAKFVADHMCHPDEDRSYDAVPWFWTDQFSHKLQIAGLVDGFDRYEQLAQDEGKFSIYCYLENALVGCESVNSPRDHVRARKELAAAFGAA
ncbi:NAD(P)/FAD-dependent oxidoreductase [Arthrobacter sp. NPDC058127]|uniref:NAD(P)/FAD-dependent oxidoreductase n=1 Tax=Arthrobacter sp. NPDC058127 TaxID=3346351 RepID=UPI0036E3AEEA